VFNLQTSDLCTCRRFRCVIIIVVQDSYFWIIDPLFVLKIQTYDHCRCWRFKCMIIVGVQDSDVRSLWRRSAAESSHKRVEGGVANVCWECWTWRRGRQSTMESASDWHCWPRGKSVGNETFGRVLLLGGLTVRWLSCIFCAYRPVARMSGIVLNPLNCSDVR